MDSRSPKACVLIATWLTVDPGPAPSFSKSTRLCNSPTIDRKGCVQLQLGANLLSAALGCALVATIEVTLEGRKVDPQSSVGQALLSS